MAASQDESKMYDDLKGFLESPDRVDLRTAACDAVLAVQDHPGMAKLVQHGLVAPLAKNCSYNDATVSVSALKALVYLTSHGTSANQCVEDLLEGGCMNRMIEIVLSQPESSQERLQWRQRVNFAMSLLANMTRTEAGAVDLVGRTLPDRAVSSKEVVAGVEKLPTKPTLELVLARFLNDDYVEPTDYDDLETDADRDSHDGDPYQHLAAVLFNATQTEAGRQFVLKMHRKDKNELGECVLQRVLPQLRSDNPVRRRGIAGCVRNCCIDMNFSWWFLNVVKITKHVLYPLAGPEQLDVDDKQGLDPDLWLEGPDKVREPDHYTRLFLVEAILLLCSSGRKAREKLRLDRTYVVLKWADMVEESEDVSEQINECVQYLRRDEEGTAEGSSDKFVEDAYKREPAKSSQMVGVGGGSGDFDDVD
jgi:hypothetical protein